MLTGTHPFNTICGPAARASLVQSELTLSARATSSTAWNGLVSKTRRPGTKEFEGAALSALAVFDARSLFVAVLLCLCMRVLVSLLSRGSQDCLSDMHAKSLNLPRSCFRNSRPGGSILKTNETGISSAILPLPISRF